MRRLALLLLLALAFSGCSDDGADDDAPDGADDGQDPGDGMDAGDDAGNDAGGDGNATDDEGGADDNATMRREPVTWHVTIEGNDFVGGSPTIQVGDTVVWTHQDGTTPHTVTADDGAFDSGACPGTACMTELNNAEFSHTFDETGEFAYHCAVHPSMTGTITVLETFAGTP